MLSPVWSNKIMKNNTRQTTFCIVALLMILITFSVTPASAQTSSNEPTAVKGQIQYSPEELELLRTKLIELLDTVKDFSDTIIPTDRNSSNQLQAARKQLLLFSLRDLDALRTTIDPSKMNKGLANSRAVLNNFKPLFGGKQPGTGTELRTFEVNSTLPGIEPPDAVCEALIGSGHASTAVVAAADAVFLAAKIIDIAANRACNQVVVAGVIILGEGAVGGGNTSAACIVSDGILFAAEKVREKISTCDDDFTKRSVDAAVSRLATIHTDLENSVANDNANKNTIVANSDANKNAIISNDNNNRTTITTAISTGTTTVTTAVGDGTAQIISNDNTNKNTIVANDNANKNTIVANDNTNRDTIVANDNANTASIIANDNANKAELKFLHLRTQIEADLSSTDGSVFVALFITPSTICRPVLNETGTAQPGQQCGYLDLVRAIVVQTIANIAGSNTAQANSFLTKGDGYKTAGDFRQAYQNYRSAYKTATR
jgi:hypothetical protein